ncbi:hypothetical protein [Streptomyces orinoci]|uniref:Integral membrane protein n=1 Tax=Streptomyces orinoci TaxID=67339 RepID=A0ABV3K0W7_STRON|nr:hypothetical protein [Streptomyces orinoci]
MNTSDNASPTRPSRSDVAARAKTIVFRGIWGVGALVVLASVLLIVGAFTADPMAGESWQPAGVLGLIGLCLGGTLLIVGMLARSVVPKPGRR